VRVHTIRSTELALHMLATRWLRKIAGITKRERRPNEDVRQELEPEKTLVDIVQYHRPLLFGHVERMSSDRLPEQSNTHNDDWSTSRGRQDRLMM